MTPLLQGGHKTFLIQSCVSFDQRCICHLDKTAFIITVLGLKVLCAFDKDKFINTTTVCDLKLLECGLAIPLMSVSEITIYKEPGI